MTLWSTAGKRWDKFMPSASYAGHCLLRTRSSGGCRAVAQHATIFSMRRRRTGLQPGEPLKNFQGRPFIGGLARLGGMVKQGVAIESGCCRSTVTHWQGASDGAIWIQICKWSAGQGKPFGPQKSNETSYAISYAISHTVWCREPTMCGSKHTILHMIRAYDIVCHDIRCRMFHVLIFFRHKIHFFATIDFLPSFSQWR